MIEYQGNTDYNHARYHFIVSRLVKFRSVIAKESRDIGEMANPGTGRESDSGTLHHPKEQGGY